MSDLDRFELFIHVATTENLSEAANFLGVAKSSLSKQIKNLEAELKVDLFSRKGHHLELTSHGRALLENCLALKKELDNTRAFCQQFHDEPEGTLSIATFGNYYASKYIFPRLAEFSERYPKLNLVINTTERIPDFAKDKVDLAIGLSFPVASDIVRRKMLSTDFMLCASPAYLKKYGTPKTLDDLKHHRYISLLSRPESHVLRLKPGYKFSIQPSLLLSSSQDMLECAEHGLGLIQLSDFKLHNALKNKTLVPVLKKYYQTGTDIFYYYPKYRYIRPALRKFIDFFLID